MSEVGKASVQRIDACLRSQPMTAREIASQVGLETRTIAAVLPVIGYYAALRCEPVHTGKRGRPELRYWLEQV